MNELNQRLQDVFLFQSADLRANRGGRITPRQQARLRAAGSNMRLAMGVFVFVMLGTLGFFVLASRQSGASEGGSTPTLLIVAAAIGVVILIGVLTSRGSMAATRSKRIGVAKGMAEVGRVRPDAAHFEIKIGATRLRLLTQEQLSAFQPGVEYRLFYLPGPAPTILSGEVVGSEAEAEAGAGEEAATPVEQDSVVRLQRRARPILFVLAGLTLGIPLLALATASLTGSLRWLVWVGMFAVAAGFVVWALRRLSG